MVQGKALGWIHSASWQGWVLTGAYVVVLVLAITLAATQPWIFWTLLGLATAAYLAVAYLTRGT